MSRALIKSFAFFLSLLAVADLSSASFPVDCHSLHAEGGDGAAQAYAFGAF